MKKNLLLVALCLLSLQNTEAAFSSQKEKMIWIDGKQSSNTITTALSADDGREPAALSARKKKRPQNDVRRWKRAAYVWMGLGIGAFAILMVLFFIFWATGMLWGWAFLVLGVYALPFLVFGILAMVFMAKFLRKLRRAKENPTPEPNPNNNPVTPQVKDVVYLKDGSIIKGTVLQIIPNDILKIEIPGGSILVYKMADVDKITKE